MVFPFQKFKVSFSNNDEGPWENEKSHRLERISNANQETTIFFPLSQDLTTRYVKLIMDDYHGDLGGLHYFSENPSSLTGASYKGKLIKINFSIFHTFTSISLFHGSKEFCKL